MERRCPSTGSETAPAGTLKNVPVVLADQFAWRFVLKTVKGASLKATEQPIDTSTAAGKAFLDMLGVFAEFETNLRKERQLEGIAKAKAAGVYKGRRPSVDVSQVRALKQEGIGPSAIAKTLGIGRASVYRALGERTS